MKKNLFETFAHTHSEDNCKYRERREGGGGERSRDADFGIKMIVLNSSHERYCVQYKYLELVMEL